LTQGLAIAQQQTSENTQNEQQEAPNTANPVQTIFQFTLNLSPLTYTQTGINGKDYAGNGILFNREQTNSIATSFQFGLSLWSKLKIFLNTDFLNTDINVDDTAVGKIAKISGLLGWKNVIMTIRNQTISGRYEWTADNPYSMTDNTQENYAAQLFNAEIQYNVMTLFNNFFDDGLPTLASGVYLGFIYGNYKFPTPIEIRRNNSLMGLAFEPQANAQTFGISFLYDSTLNFFNSPGFLDDMKSSFNNVYFVPLLSLWGYLSFGSGEISKNASDSINQQLQGTGAAFERKTGAFSTGFEGISGVSFIMKAGRTMVNISTGVNYGLHFIRSLDQQTFYFTPSYIGLAVRAGIVF
jgi:hypothetical protein